LDDVFPDPSLIEPPDLLTAALPDSGRNILKPDHDPDFLFKREPGQRPTTLIFRSENRFGFSVAHALSP
jgi:hypothetical protein